MRWWLQPVSYIKARRPTRFFQTNANNKSKQFEPVTNSDQTEPHQTNNKNLTSSHIKIIIKSFINDNLISTTQEEPTAQDLENAVAGRLETVTETLDSKTVRIIDFSQDSKLQLLEQGKVESYLDAPHIEEQDLAQDPKLTGSKSVFDCIE